MPVVSLPTSLIYCNVRFAGIEVVEVDGGILYSDDVVLRSRRLAASRLVYLDIIDSRNTWIQTVSGCDSRYTGVQLPRRGLKHYQKGGCLVASVLRPLAR